MGYFKIKYR